MMELPVINFSEALGTKLAVGLLTVITAATSGVAGYKIVKTVSAQTPPKAEAVEVPSVDAESEAGGTVSTGVQITPTPTTKPVTTQVSGSVSVKPTSGTVSGRLSISGDTDEDEDDDDKKEYEMETKESETQQHDESKTEEKTETEMHIEDGLTR